MKGIKSSVRHCQNGVQVPSFFFKRGSFARMAIDLKEGAASPLLGPWQLPYPSITCPRFIHTLTDSLFPSGTCHGTQAGLGSELSKGSRCLYHQLTNGYCLTLLPPTHGGHQKGGRRLKKTNGFQQCRNLGMYDGTLVVYILGGCAAVMRSGKDAVSRKRGAVFRLKVCRLPRVANTCTAGESHGVHLDNYRCSVGWFGGMQVSSHVWFGRS